MTMARSPNDPNHPLVRLRAILSTPKTKKVPANEMSREKFAKKTGIPAASLKDIENGKFKLSHDAAMKIVGTFGVHWDGLMGKGPLLDLEGFPFSKNSPKPVYLQPHEEDALEQLCLAAWEVAIANKRGILVEYSFEMWLLKTFEEFGLKTALSEKLTERLGLFDPNVLALFRPKNKQLSKEWENLSAEIDQEQRQVFNEDKMANPDSPHWTESQKVVHDQMRMEGGRSAAVERVCRKRQPKRAAREDLFEISYRARRTNA